MVRHGETKTHREKVLLGRMSGYPLTETGREDVKKVAEYLRTKNIGVVYTCPLERTLETSQIISKAIGVEPVKKEAFIETDYGDWTGFKILELQEEFSSGWKKWEDVPDQFTIPNGESLSDVQKQALEEFYQVISDQRSHLGIVIVSHVKVSFWEFWGFRFLSLASLM